MPYDKRNPTLNQMMQDTMKMEFSSTEECLNKIVTSFKSYEAFNNCAEKYAVKYDLRGLGRFHECMGKRAYKDATCFGKKVIDHPYGILTEPNYEEVEKSSKWGFYNYGDLMHFLTSWDKYLKEMNMLFTHSAYYLADKKQVSLYRELCKYVEQIENEQWAVGVLIDRLTYDNYQHPDLRGIMKKLHVYFENHYNGGDIDFDL